MLNGFTRYNFKELGGYVSCMPAERVPPGSAVSARNVRFLPSSVRIRDGLTQTWTLPLANQSVNGLGELIVQSASTLYWPLVYGSAGELYRESVVGSGSLQKIADGLTADAFCQFSTAYSRAYMSFGDRKTGLAAPKQYYAYQGGYVLRDCGAASNAVAATAAENATLGDVIAGTRYVTVFFETETGYQTGFTDAAVSPLTVTSDEVQITVSNIPVGPDGTVRRWVAFTASGGSSAGDFFTIPEAVTLQEANAPYTATMIDNNVDTSATFNFSDDFLQASTNVTLYLDKQPVPQAGNVKFLPSIRRIAYSAISDTPSAVQFSEPDDPETCYVTGLVQVAENNGERVVCPFEFRNTVYVAKENSGHALTPNDTDPATWKVTELWNKVGPCGTEALDVCDEFVVFASRKGLYKFDGGGAPDWISWEHGGPGGLWERINWEYGELVTVTIDTETKRIFVAVPLDQATACSHVFTCDYANGFSAPVQPNPINGVLVSLRGRRWSVDDVATNKILRMERPLQAGPSPFVNNAQAQSQLLVASSAADSAVNILDATSFTDNGQKIAAEYQTAFQALGGIYTLGAVTVDARGTGNLALSSHASTQHEHQLAPIALGQVMTEKTVKTTGNSTNWSVKLRAQSTSDTFEVGEIALWLKDKWAVQVEGR